MEHYARISFSGVKRVFGAELADDLSDGCAGFSLPQDMGDLLVGEAGFLHSEPLSRADIRQGNASLHGSEKPVTVTNAMTRTPFNAALRTYRAISAFP